MAFILSVFRRPITAAAIVFAITVGAGLVPAVLAAPASGYHEVARYPVGGEGGWDYLTYDSANHRLFISRGSHVQVVDSGSGKFLGDIPDTKGCHGSALAPDLKRGFVSDGGDNTVTVFDTDTLKTLSTVPVGQRPDAIIYEPATKRVFTFNAGSSDTTAIDAASGKVVGSIPLGGKPEFAASDGKGKLFVNIEDKSEILTLDPRALTVLRTTPLAPAESPSGLALDLKTETLFAAGDNKLAAVVDGKSGKLIATPPIGDGPDAAAFDPGTGLAFTSNGGDGTLTVLRRTGPATFATETIPTERGARTMALDPATHRLYLVTAKFEPVPADAQPVNGRRPRPKMIPDSFVVIVYGPGGK